MSSLITLALHERLGHVTSTLCRRGMVVIRHAPIEAVIAKLNLVSRSLGCVFDQMVFAS